MADVVYDLHSHSYLSDGVLSPTDVVNRAAEKGVTVHALTDHDCVDGIAEASEAAKAAGIKLIPGTEISVGWANAEIHVVALNVDVNNAQLLEGLESQKQRRLTRGKIIGEGLQKQGCGDAYAGAREIAQGEILGRVHFGRYLVQEGHAKDIPHAFKKYLIKGKPAYTPTSWPDIEEIMQWVNAAGGQAVIAHPARYKLTMSKLRHLLRDFKEAGGQGLEVAAASHSVDQIQQMANLCNEYQLLASAGSDFHDPAMTWTDIGRVPAIPKQCVPIWRDWD